MENFGHKKVIKHLLSLDQNSSRNQSWEGIPETGEGTEDTNMQLGLVHE